MKQPQSIKFLLTIAVLLLVYHNAIEFGANFGVSKQLHFFHLRQFGYTGLDLFIIITGFMTGYYFNNFSGKKDGFSFLRDRFIKINITYYVGTSIFLVIICLFHRTYPMLYIYNGLRDMALPIRILNSQDQFILMLVDSWPYSFMWLFYLFFVVTIFFKTKNKLPVISILIISLTIIGFLLPADGDFRFKYFTSPIMLEFLMGMIIYWGFQRYTVPGKLAIAFVLLGVGGYIYNLLYCDDSIFKSKGDGGSVLEITRVVALGIPSALLVIGSIGLEYKQLFNSLWRNRFFQLTGNAAFSIFLIYPSVFFLTTVLYGKIGGVKMNADFGILIHIPLVYGIGILFHKKAEHFLHHFFEYSAPTFAIK